MKIEELENVPAYVRKKVAIDQTKHSEDKEVSRYRLTEFRALEAHTDTGKM